MIFVLGLLMGLTVGGLIVGWALTARNSPIVTADPWWLENADRWEWLRTHELESRSQ